MVKRCRDVVGRPDLIRRRISSGESGEKEIKAYGSVCGTSGLSE
jgi:hypothetical protein